MYKDFKEFFKIGSEEIESLWTDSLIVLDTNVILNIYRYSDGTNDAFLNVLKKFQDRLWIPHQVGKEFMRKRLTVIEQQIKAYADAKKDTNSLEELFSNKKRNPFLSDQLLAELIEVFKKVNRELDLSKEKYEERLLNDDLLIIISELFENRVGKQPSEAELQEIAVEAQDRFDKKVPPGFEDLEKGENQFGDYIIWKQILQKSKSEKRKVIFITDDAKKDWWEIVSGKTLGPRSELKKEFLSLTGELYHMYNPFTFIKYATERLNVSITMGNLDEIKLLKPLNKTDEIGKTSIIITASIQKSSKDANSIELLKNLKQSGYDMRVEDIDENNIKLYFSVPNIPDLPRRIKKRMFENIDIYGFTLIDFKPIS